MSDIRLSVAVVHAPWGAHRPTWLRALVDAVVGPITIVADDRREGVWPTSARAWGAVDPGATHHLVLQDDIMVCRDFRRHVEAGLHAHWRTGRGVATGYAHHAVRRALAVAARGDHWLPLLGMTGGYALCLPVGAIRPMLAWTARMFPPEYTSDVRLTLYLLTYGVPVWYTVPSLVRHVGARASLIGHQHFTNTSELFTDTLPGDIDWTAGTDAEPVQVQSVRALVRNSHVPLRVGVA